MYMYFFMTKKLLFVKIIISYANQRHRFADTNKSDW